MLTPADAALALIELAEARAAASTLTPEEVATWARVPVDADLVAVVEAVNAFIHADCPDVGRYPNGEWDATTRLGATMLAARWLRRRNSPNGVEALTETGISYVSRYDPDLARMLRIDGYQLPKVG